eukprot:m.112340 g.112340  ORF g.112340 m.112340 type:complete len:370 (-) comp16175_c2_seq2:1051-2160(-)
MTRSNARVAALFQRLATLEPAGRSCHCSTTAFSVDVFLLLFVVVAPKRIRSHVCKLNLLSIFDKLSFAFAGMARGRALVLSARQELLAGPTTGKRRFVAWHRTGFVTTNALPRNEHNTGRAGLFIVAPVAHWVSAIVLAVARLGASRREGSARHWWFNDRDTAATRQLFKAGVETWRAVPCMARLLAHVLATTQHLVARQRAWVCLRTGKVPHGAANLCTAMTTAAAALVAGNLAHKAGILLLLVARHLALGRATTATDGHDGRARRARPNVARFFASVGVAMAWGTGKALVALGLAHRHRVGARRAGILHQHANGAASTRAGLLERVETCWRRSGVRAQGLHSPEWQTSSHSCCPQSSIWLQRLLQLK